MAFKVVTDTALNEDDEVVTDANSYASIEDFLQYWVDRNIDYSDYEPEQLQAALINATDYIEMRFVAVWKGTRIYADQALAWPRRRVYDREGVLLEGLPRRLLWATYEYASRALTANLAPDPEVDQNIRSKSESVGPISETVTYNGSAVAEKFKSYPKADAWLAELTTGTGAKTYR